MRKVKIEEKPKRKLLMFGVLVFIIATALMITSGIGASLWGAQLHGVEQEIAKIESENRILVAEIVGKSSLTEVYAKAEEMGFAPPGEVRYIETNTAVAQLPR